MNTSFRHYLPLPAADMYYTCGILAVFYLQYLLIHGTLRLALVLAWAYGPGDTDVGACAGPAGQHAALCSFPCLGSHM